jgi:hypothetical protein
VIPGIGCCDAEVRRDGDSLLPKKELRNSRLTQEPIPMASRMALEVRRWANLPRFIFFLIQVSDWCWSHLPTASPLRLFVHTSGERGIPYRQIQDDRVSQYKPAPKSDLLARVPGQNRVQDD